ncbi:diiron oxygenase [Crocosphaera sp. XPORK-15E]|uniref:diiron oxygenase n=1 Tax=Crocosphaera sp. XPORK-15E TaxID=3110247 RepID=UPI002B1F59C9|nr:diiron oxygenase [Crocosphaera sp. XPORK-15E]MEA5535836.1 diiron oxygenase [Crocosphaera sp. XPORK-15E]
METIAQCRTLLERMNNVWEKRSQVKKQELDPTTLLDRTRPDFRVDLLPFKNHPAFLEASQETKDKILSCGWLIYNWKTVAIELKVVNPVCQDIIYQMFPGVSDAIVQEVATDTLVDESYHVQLVNKACSITRQQRGLQSLRSPEFNLVLNMQREQELYQEDWQKLLIKLATSVVSEVFVSDYLKLLSSDQTIQPFNRVVVDTHRRDEDAHSCIFKNLVKCIYSELTIEQKEFFISVLPKPVYWFADLELEVWKSMLEQIDFAGAQAIYNDCSATNTSNLQNIDYSEVIELVQELDYQGGAESLAKMGLLN